MQMENEKKWNIIFGFAVGVVLLFIIILLVKENRKNGFQDNVAYSTKFDTTVAIKTYDKEIEVWNYSERIDKMDGRKSYYALTTSTNQLYFNSPYDGGSTFILALQKLPGEMCSVYLKVTKGQLLGSSNKKARIKIDDEKPFYVSVSGTSDYQSNIIFLHSTQKIIKNLLKAKKVIVEAEIYQEGMRQAEFDVKDLVWNH